MTSTDLDSDLHRVLAAIESAGLLAMIDPDVAMSLATPVARVGAGLTLDEESAGSALRALDRVRAQLDPPLSAMGLTVPPPAKPVPPKQTTAKRGNRPILKRLSDGRIGVQSPFALKEVVKGLTGATWNKERRIWTIPGSPAAAAEALETLAPWAPVASEGVAAMAAQFAETRSARVILEDGAPLPDGDLSDVITVAGWDHQRRGVAFSEVAEALLFAVPMGGGKSAMALASVNRRQAHTVLIVAPNAARRVWTREAREKSAVAWHIEDGTRPPRRGTRRQDLSAAERVERAERLWWSCTCDAPVHAFVINYEQMASPVWKRWRPPHKLDAVIYDEGHRLKSPTGAASKLAHRWVDYFRFRLALSGTPMPQSPLDAFGLMRALDPGLFGTTWTAFKNRYAVMDPTGTFPLSGKLQNEAELAEKFMSITYRPKIDLKLPGALPPVRRYCELEPEARKVYQSLDDDLWADLTPFMAERAAHGLDADPADVVEAMTMAAEFDENGQPAEIIAQNLLTKMLRLQQLTGGWLEDEDGTLHRVSHAKANDLAEAFDEYRVGPDEPVVVACRFKADLAVVREIAESKGLRYGEISGRTKDGLDDDARMNPDIDVCGVQIQSGGTGIDLTRSALAFNFSVGYSLSDFDQWLKRTDRPGQTRVVRYVDFVAADTMDEAVYDAMKMRRAVIAACLAKGGVDPRSLGVYEPVPERGEAAPNGSRAMSEVAFPWD